MFSISTPISICNSLDEYNTYEEEQTPKNGRTIWKEIMQEYLQSRKAIEEYKKTKEKKTKILSEEKETEIDYLNSEIFPILLPALVDTLYKAIEWDVIKVQKSRFNGIDYIVECIWNRNPRHPDRMKEHIEIFCIPFVKQFLKEHPRPLYPLSWIWTREEACLIIQCYVRGWLVRKRPEVQELRQFWRCLEEEKKEEENKRAEKKRIRMEKKIEIKKEKKIKEKMVKCLNELRNDRRRREMEGMDEEGAH